MITLWTTGSVTPSGYSQSLDNCKFVISRIAKLLAYKKPPRPINTSPFYKEKVRLNKALSSGKQHSSLCSFPILCAKFFFQENSSAQTQQTSLLAKLFSTKKHYTWPSLDDLSKRRHSILQPLPLHQNSSLSLGGSKNSGLLSLRQFLSLPANHRT